MEQYKGLAIAPGMALGPLWALKEKTFRAEEAASPEQEKERFARACETAQAQLAEVCKTTLEKYGAENAAVFEIHGMLIEDEDFQDCVLEAIDGGADAVSAVKRAGDECAAVFEQSEDEYTRERAGDFRDIALRLCEALSGAGDDYPDQPSVIFADELTPSQTVKFPRDRILGFVTRKGSLNSHAGILARNFGIPAVSGVDLAAVPGATPVAVNGFEGVVWVDPDGKTAEDFRTAIRRGADAEEQRKKLRDLPSVTRDGRRIRICANMGNVEDLPLVTESGAEGVGLFRSEFLYLSREDYPPEDELFEAYKKAAEALSPHPLIIRTLDIGADKQADYFGMAHEENPALGVRAIRLCLQRPELLRTQLRAILRSTVFGHIGIMFPMITSLNEIRQLKAAVSEAEASLRGENIPVGEYEFGIMVETPAAAIISDELAKEVDFFSIGTNDLSQYTLAIDRQNSDLAPYFDPHHKAILRLIDMTVANGHAGGCWVGICGELGGDRELLGHYLDIGLDEISVSPAKVLALRQYIREEL